MWILKCYIFQDIIVKSADEIKSHLSHSFHVELMKTEYMFPSTNQTNNPATGNWITSYVKNLSIDQMSKIMLLLKTNFAHWLSVESG